MTKGEYIQRFDDAAAYSHWNYADITTSKLQRIYPKRSRNINVLYFPSIDGDGNKWSDASKQIRHQEKDMNIKVTDFFYTQRFT